jgi:hypothetical protein
MRRSAGRRGSRSGRVGPAESGAADVRGFVGQLVPALELDEGQASGALDSLLGARVPGGGPQDAGIGGEFT